MNIDTLYVILMCLFLVLLSYVEVTFFHKKKEHGEKPLLSVSIALFSATLWVVGLVSQLSCLKGDCYGPIFVRSYFKSIGVIAMPSFLLLMTLPVIVFIMRGNVHTRKLTSFLVFLGALVSFIINIVHETIQFMNPEVGNEDVIGPNIWVYDTNDIVAYITMFVIMFIVYRKEQYKENNLAKN